MNYCLKVGTKYSVDHVHRLAEHIPDLTCLTDDPAGLETEYKDVSKIPLEKWWYKMLLFNEQLFPEAGTFFDLDIDIRKPIDGVFNPVSEKMTLLKTNWENLDELNKNTIGDRYKYCSINSSVMAWKESNRHSIWEDFEKNREKIMFLFSGIDTYLEHRHLSKLEFFETGLVSSQRSDPKSDVYIMSYDGKGKDEFDLYDE